MPNEDVDDSHVPLVMASVIEKEGNANENPTLLTESVLMDGTKSPSEQKDNLLPYTSEDFQEQIEG